MTGKCGARTRVGGKCRQPAQSSGRCRFHGQGGGAPQGNKNRLIHGAHSTVITESEVELYERLQATNGLDTDAVPMARLQLHRAMVVHRDLQEQLEAGKHVDPDALDRSFDRASRLCRTLARLVEVHLRLAELPEMRAQLETMQERVQRIRKEREEEQAAALITDESRPLGRRAGGR